MQVLCTGSRSVYMDNANEPHNVIILKHFNEKNRAVVVDIKTRKRKTGSLTFLYLNHVVFPYSISYDYPKPEVLISDFIHSFLRWIPYRRCIWFLPIKQIKIFRLLQWKFSVKLWYNITWYKNTCFYKCTDYST